MSIACTVASSADVTRTPSSMTPLSITEHARRLGVSVPALRDAVRASGTDGPKELVLRARLDHAKALLTTTTMSVRQVAHEVGYHDPAYFTRLFTRRTGMPPRTFRHRHRGDVRIGEGDDLAPTRTRSGPAQARPWTTAASSWTFASPGEGTCA